MRNKKKFFAIFLQRPTYFSQLKKRCLSYIFIGTDREIFDCIVWDQTHCAQACLHCTVKTNLWAKGPAVEKFLQKNSFFIIYQASSHLSWRWKRAVSKQNSISISKNKTIIPKGHKSQFVTKTVRIYWNLGNQSTALKPKYFC